ncbi:unnamed protein product, partial [Durusdinium trenchii]
PRLSCSRPCSVDSKALQVASHSCGRRAPFSWPSTPKRPHPHSLLWSRSSHLLRVGAADLMAPSDSAKVAPVLLGVGLLIDVYQDYPIGHHLHDAQAMFFKKIGAWRREAPTLGWRLLDTGCVE